VGDKQVGVRGCRSRILVRFAKSRQNQIANDITASRVPIHGAAEDVWVGHVDVWADRVKPEVFGFDQFAVTRSRRNHRRMTATLHLPSQNKNRIEIAKRAERAEYDAFSSHSVNLNRLPGSR
jgi:hypothetical protein